MDAVIFVARSSSFLLSTTTKHHIKKYKNDYPSTFSILNSRLYVDAVINNLEDTDLACIIHEQISFILEEADFNMRKGEQMYTHWKTNLRKRVTVNPRYTKSLFIARIQQMMS